MTLITEAEYYHLSLSAGAIMRWPLRNVDRRGSKDMSVLLRIVKGPQYIIQVPNSTPSFMASVKLIVGTCAVQDRPQRGKTRTLDGYELLLGLHRSERDTHLSIGAKDTFGYAINGHGPRFPLLLSAGEPAASLNIDINIARAYNVDLPNAELGRCAWFKFLLYLIYFVLSTLWANTLAHALTAFR